MKFYLIFALLFSVVACQSEANKTVEPATTATTQEKTEDCDEAAKKPIEIKEETISLNNTTGCTLEE